MNSKNKFIYKNDMKKSRSLYKNMGLTLIIFLIGFGMAKDYLFIPFLGKIWGLVLKTTPDGFISNANLINTIIKCPWIILIGLILIMMRAFISMWQISAIIVEIDYIYHDKYINIIDLIKISFTQIVNRINRHNWLILVYALVIIPFINIYQTNDLVASYMIPEYIQDFINNNTVLFVLFVILVLFVIYISLRWMFILPSFILKKKDFKEAKKESDLLTQNCWLKNGVNKVIYSLIELIRLSIVPLFLIITPVFICYYFTSNLEFSTRLFNTIGVTWGFEIVKNVTGTLVQISTVCFIVELYFTKLKEKGIHEELALPEIEYEGLRKISINKIQIIFSVIISIVIAGAYLITVNVAQTDSSIILDMFGSTKVIAHKGYSSKAPENTMPAFKLADKSEVVSYIELDVWSSKDGIPVVIHNASIKDATGVDKLVYECTAQELREIPAPYNMDKNKFKDAYIPTLEEVIKEYGYSTPLLIEIKGFKQDPNLSSKIVELLKKYGCEYTSLIHSGDYRAIEAVKKIDSDIECGLILAIVTGNYYDLPYADFFSVEHTFIDEKTVSTLHKRGKEIFAWTVNYEESVDNLKFSGVDAIITDVPDEIAIYVNNSNTLVEDAFNKLFINQFIKIGSNKAISSFENDEY